MKIINILFTICFLGMAFLGRTQNEITHNNSCVFDIFPNEDILLVVNDPKLDVEKLLAKTKFENDEHKARSIIAMGFMVTPSNKEAVNFLTSTAHSESYCKKSAIQALFRVGGTPLEKYLTILFSKDDFKLQIWAIENTWVLDNLQDLQILDTITKKVIQENPEWNISKYLSKTYSYRLEIAMKVLENAQPLETEKLLKSIIEYKNESFNYVPGAVGYAWAIKMLVRTMSLSDKERLIEYFIERKNLRSSPQLKEAYFFYLSQLGYNLTNEEGEWVSGNQVSMTSHTFIVLRSEKEINEYYSFREKYPFKPDHRH